MTTAHEVKTPTNAGAIQKKQTPKTTKDWLKVYAAEIGKALPSQIEPDRFNRICMTALTVNPALANCDSRSFIGAVLNAAQLGMEPNTPLGQAYLIPYKGRVQFQLGYKGMIQLARNSGEISMIKAHAVHMNDEFSYELGLNPNIKHIPVAEERGPVVAYYAFYKTKDGDFDFEVATRQEMEDFGKRYSQSYAKGPWSTNFDEMAKKTLIKRVLKYAPMSTDVALKIITDESVKSFNPKEAELMKDMANVYDEALEVEFEEREVKQEDEA